MAKNEQKKLQKDEEIYELKQKDELQRQINQYKKYKEI